MAREPAAPDEATPVVPPFRGNLLGEARFQLELAALLAGATAAERCA